MTERSVYQSARGQMGRDSGGMRKEPCDIWAEIRRKELGKRELEGQSVVRGSFF